MQVKEKKIVVKAFGMIAEKINTRELVMEGEFTTDSLRTELIQRFPDLKSSKFSISVNKVLITQDTPIEADSEVALLPPFSGG